MEDIEKKIEFVEYLLNQKHFKGYAIYSASSGKYEPQPPKGLTEWDKNFLKSIKKIQYYPNPKISDKQLTQLWRMGQFNIGWAETHKFLGEPPTTYKQYFNTNRRWILAYERKIQEIEVRLNKAKKYGNHKKIKIYTEQIERLKESMDDLSNS